MPALLRNPDRPLALSVIFWLVLTLMVVRYVIYELGGPIPPEWTFILNVLVVVWLWLILPWEPSATQLRKLAAPGFVVAATSLGLTGSETVHLPLILLGFAVTALVYGMVIAATAMVALAAVRIVLAFVYANTLSMVVNDVLALIIGGILVLGLASATLEARRRRDEGIRLLERIRDLVVAEERARIAQDMHDSIGHHLTIIKIGLENAERFRERRPEAAWDEVRQTKDLTRQALAETRRWVRALRPLDLEGHVGSAALQRLARSFDGSGVTIDFQVDGEERPLNADAELVLYRVLQEGLTNVLRHSGAARVQVRLAFDKAMVTLAISDDGDGSDAEPGFGLTSLAERTEALGGTLHAHGTNEDGFELRAELPVTGR